MTTTSISRDAWLSEFSNAVGEDQVIQPGDPRLDEYLDPYAFDDRHPPAAVVRPSSVEEIQEILSIARRHDIPLWTVSRGRNFAYGGAEARVPGSVVCDLGRMDRVLSVDDETGVAIVEPGVSFQALDAHLRSTGSRLAVSVPDLSWGSVVGNTLERGFSYTTNSEHQAMQCGMEVVLSDGDVLRTGMGGLPGSSAWANYRGSFGPSFDGLFLQSNFGIVTKMGIWLRSRPERAACVSISVPADDQLGLLIDSLRPLLLDGTIQSNVVIGNALIASSAATTRQPFYDGPGLMPAEALTAMMNDLGLGRWNAQFGVYGVPTMMAARRREIEAAVSRIPGAHMEFAEYPGDVNPALVAPPHRTQLGVPSNEAIGMVEWRGGESAHTDIGLVCAPTAKDADAIRGMVGRAVEAAGFDFAVGFMLWPRHIVAMTLITFDRSDDEQRAALGGVVTTVIREAADAGYGIYRAHLSFMDDAAAIYSFNDHAGLRLAERIKNLLDPHCILSPGKQGIWPAGRHTNATAGSSSTPESSPE